VQKVRSTGRINGTGLRFLPVTHEGNQSSSPEEADQVCDIVADVLSSGASWVDRTGVDREVALEDMQAPSTVLLEGLFRHFDNRRQVASYAGLAPTPWLRVLLTLPETCRRDVLWPFDYEVASIRTAEASKGLRAFLQSFRDLTTDLAARMSRSVKIGIKVAVQEVLIQSLIRRLGQDRGALDRTVVHDDVDLEGTYLPTPSGTEEVHLRRRAGADLSPAWSYDQDGLGRRSETSSSLIASEVRDCSPRNDTKAIGIACFAYVAASNPAPRNSSATWQHAR